MAATTACVLRVGCQLRGIRLEHSVVFQEQQALLAGRHEASEILRLLKRRAQTLRNRSSVDGFGHRKIGVIVRQITRIATNLPDQALGRKTGVLGDRRPDHSA